MSMMDYFKASRNFFTIHRKRDNIRKHSLNLWQETIENCKSSSNLLTGILESFSANIRLVTRVARNYQSHMPRVMSGVINLCLWKSVSSFALVS